MNKNPASGKKPQRYDLQQAKKRRTVFIIAFALLAASSFMIGIYHPIFQKAKVAEVKNFNALTYFPLQKGNSWTYVYETKTADGKGKTTKKNGRIIMEVKQVYKLSNYYLAVLSGDPVSCAPDARYGYLVGSNKVFYIPENYLGAFEKAARQKLDPPMEQLSPEDGYYEGFELPMFVGLRWGSPQSVFRGDGNYSWYIGQETYVQLGSKKKSPVIKCFELSYRTIPDHKEILFSPGLGIIKSSYTHNGTTDSYVVRLAGYTITPQK